MIAFNFNLDFWLRSPVLLVFGLFVIWMLVDAVRREEWLWVLFIFLFPMINAPLYFFLVYRNASPFATRGFELPGAHDRRRIKELQAQIHHLDKAHHHYQLGNIFFQQGKLPKALECYQKAYERDTDDIDIRSHLGQCLLRLNRPAEALPLLEKVCAEDSKHEYGHTLMALAETYMASNNPEAAIQTWQRVLEQNGYARARVQLAELYTARQQIGLARSILEEVIADDLNAPDFQRKQDRVWVRRAKRLLRPLREAAT